MNTTIEQKKQKAIELMTELAINKPYIIGFKKDNKVCLYERFAGFWVEQYPEIEKIMREIEKEYNCCVYAITHEYLSFGECYDFLIVPNDDADWDYVMDYLIDGSFYVFAYVWNKTFQSCSEFGSIAVKSLGGGLCRVE